MRNYIFFVLFFVSCSTITQKPTSAEIGIEAAEKIIDKMPDNAEKVVLSTALKQSKAELGEYRSINKDLSKENKKNEKIAIEKSQDAGKWYATRDIGLYIAGFIFTIILGFAIYIGYKAALKRGLL